MIPPLSAHWYSLWWSLSFLSEVFVIDNPITLEIMSDRNLSYHFCSSVETPGMLVKPWSDNGYIISQVTCPMPSITKYPHTCLFISVRYICSTFQNMLLRLTAVTTMNSRRPQPYLFSRLINCSTTYLTFETVISNLSVSFYISLVSWR